MKIRLTPLLLLAFSLLVLTSCKNRAGKGNLAKSTRHYYDETPVKASFSDLEGYRQHPGDEVPWAAALNYNADNGVMAFYFPEGAQVLMATPQIRMEYLSKSLEGCESEAGLFSWLKELFTAAPYNGTVITESESHTTKDGRKVRLLEIHTPPRESQSGEATTQFAGKKMAWSYIDTGDFWVAINATSTDEEAWPRLRRALVTLVETFQFEGD